MLKVKALDELLIRWECRRGIPRLMMTDHRVDDRQELPHHGGQGDFRRLPRRDQAFVEGPQHGVMAFGRQGGHVQQRADGATAARDAAAALQSPAVACHRGQAHQGA